MKQVRQNPRTGEIELAEVPSPRAKAKHLLIRTSVSLISPDTERMLIEFGKVDLVDKVRLVARTAETINVRPVIGRFDSQSWDFRPRCGVAVGVRE